MGLDPLLPDVGICALVPDQWNSTWRRRHHVLTRLARYFQVVWVNPAPEWRDLYSSSRSDNSNATDITPLPGFTVYNPVWLPHLYRPKRLAQYTSDARVKSARRILIRRGCRKIILYICRPGFAPALHSIPFDLSCYHIDDEY